MGGAPLRADEICERRNMWWCLVVEQIAVGPMFHHVSPWIQPIVVDLASENVASNTPLVRVATAREVRVATHEVVKVGDFERRMVERRLSRTDEEQRVMIHEF